MIIVCDIICKSISHEKVNSGFLYALRLAYPNEPILVFADKTHIQALKNILLHDDISIGDIDYKEVNFSDSGSPSAFLRYIFLITKIFNTAIRFGIEKLFFLSFSPQILYIIKRLKRRNVFSGLKFLMVTHADFENIRREPKDLETGKSQIKQKEKNNLLNYLFTVPVSKIPKKLVASVLNKILGFNRYTNKSFIKLFSTKAMIVGNNTDDYRYLALAPYILDNAKEYIDLKVINLYSVILPTVFAPIKKVTDNNYPIFAIFGFGNTSRLKLIIEKLDSYNLKNKYVVRIIGMDTKGLENLPNVECLSPGKRLSRIEMESYATNVDMFLNLYIKNEYRLSCSNSILEALSYNKPIIHFDNDCINFFNDQNNPIGIKCNNVEEFADAMAFIINDYENFKYTLKKFRDNISKVRDKYSIPNSINNLKNAYSWN